ncbi:hypothetical protein ACFWAY_43610 [Rhodococcus sp. NPDC059968]|uniref:hypothetical protein n=1 Tax=Rhodococcus sp. NPDC059968 TaxID=3347017 RepID=UPI00367170FC
MTDGIGQWCSVNGGGDAGLGPPLGYGTRHRGRRPAPDRLAAAACCPLAPTVPTPRGTRGVYTGGLPSGLDHYAGPLLALAGEREPTEVARSFEALRRRLPRTVTRMNHAWSIGDADLFTRVTRQWIETGTVATELRP